MTQDQDNELAHRLESAKVEIRELDAENKKLKGIIMELEMKNFILQRDLTHAFMELTLKARDRISRRCPLFNTGMKGG